MVVVKLFRDTEINVSSGNNPFNRCTKCLPAETSCSASKEHCSLCNNIIKYIKDTFSSDYAKFKENYDITYATESNTIDSLLVAQNKKKTEIRQLKNTIAQLKSRLDLKSKVLAAYPLKIETLMENLNSNISRNKLSSVDKVNVGLPYLPFFSLPTNQYIIGVSVLTILLLIVLLIYAFTDLFGKKPLS